MPSKAFCPYEPEGTRTILGLDFGVSDETAFIIGEYGEHDPTLHVLEVERYPEGRLQYLGGEA